MNMKIYPAVLGVWVIGGPQLQRITLSQLHRAMHPTCTELAKLIYHVSVSVGGGHAHSCVPYIRVVLLLCRLAKVRQLT